MNKFCRHISFLVALVMLLAVPTFASENTTPRASSYIMSTCIYLDQTSSTQFDVWFEVIARGQMDEVGAYEVKIQQSTDGEAWTSVKVFTGTVSNGMLDEDTHAHAGHVSYTGTRGYYYRARIILYAKNSNGHGEIIDYTETLKL